VIKMTQTDTILALIVRVGNSMIDSLSKPKYKRLDNNGHYLVAVSESLFLVDIRQSIEQDFKLHAD